MPEHSYSGNRKTNAMNCVVQVFFSISKKKYLESLCEYERNAVYTHLSSQKETLLHKCQATLELSRQSWLRFSFIQERHTRNSPKGITYFNEELRLSRIPSTSLDAMETILFKPM